jgi:hypothetical protein
MKEEYRLVCAVQAPLERVLRVFWELEQRKGQLADQLANNGILVSPRRRVEAKAK